MTHERPVDIQPPRRANRQSDLSLDLAEETVDATDSVDASTITPRTNLGVDGRPLTEALEMP